MTQSHINQIIIAPAGGRKTTSVVEDALSQPKDKKILITTYTLENLDQIETYIIERKGYVPINITISSWFRFLLIDGVRPYQSFISQKIKIESIDFESRPWRYIPKTCISYYINRVNNIYRDRVSDFVCRNNDISRGLVIDRLERIYDIIYIDEMQDLSGWDYNLVELLLGSSIKLTIVGDPRQTTYATTNSQKNKRIGGGNMLSWIKKLEKNHLCEIEERSVCYRCNQEICNFADDMYPELKKTVSKNVKKTGHDGVFFLKTEEVKKYVILHNPVVLRWNKNSETMGFQAINFGVSKGKTYPRVLIFPTQEMRTYLNDKKTYKLKSITKSKLYVAITRAMYSVSFVLE